MTKIYAALIIKGKKTIDDVPEKLRKDVIKILDEEGYSPDGSKKGTTLTEKSGDAE